MTKIKLCGLSGFHDIEIVNKLKPDYIGFVFAPKSRRYVSPETALELKSNLHPAIKAVGVFVREQPETIAALLQRGVIDIVQLHGGEPENDILTLRALTNKPIIQAFRIDTAQDIDAANQSSADYVLLDSGSGGTGKLFDWTFLRQINRPYFLAGGLSPGNVGNAVELLNPYGVDVSSGIETDGCKDINKMTYFVSAVRNAQSRNAQNKHS